MKMKMLYSCVLSQEKLPAKDKNYHTKMALDQATAKVEYYQKVQKKSDGHPLQNNCHKNVQLN